MEDLIVAKSDMMRGSTNESDENVEDRTQNIFGLCVTEDPPTLMVMHMLESIATGISHNLKDAQGKD